MAAIYSLETSVKGSPLVIHSCDSVSKTIIRHPYYGQVPKVHYY